LHSLSSLRLPSPSEAAADGAAAESGPPGPFSGGARKSTTSPLARPASGADDQSGEESDDQAAADGAAAESGPPGPFSGGARRSTTSPLARPARGADDQSREVSDDLDLDPSSDLDGDRPASGNTVRRADGSDRWTSEQRKDDAERTAKIVKKLLRRTVHIKHMGYRLGRGAVMEVVESTHGIVQKRGSLVKPGYAKVDNLECASKKANADWEFANGCDMLIAPNGTTRFESISAAVDADQEYYYIYADLLNKY